MKPRTNEIITEMPSRAQPEEEASSDGRHLDLVRDMTETRRLRATGTPCGCSWCGGVDAQNGHPLCPECRPGAQEPKKEPDVVAYYKATRSS